MSKFKVSIDNKFGAAEIMGFVFERVENIVGKGDNAGYQHCLLFLQCFQKTSYSGSLKVGIVWKVKTICKRLQLLQNNHILQQDVFCETWMPAQRPFFPKLWPWSLILTLTDVLDFETKERVLPQGIHYPIWNMKALPLTIQKLWLM